MSDILVDALPYIDLGYDEPGVREAVLQMVEEETRRYKATKNYLENLEPLNLQEFETDIMRSEFERLQNRQPMDMLNMKRYELPAPTAGKMTDISAWNECVDNSMAQLEHQAIRIANLELINRLGAEGWKTYNTVLTQMMQNSQKQLQELRKQIQEVNWLRKSSQMAAGEKARLLESSWVSLVSKNYEIERACVQLEYQISQLEAQKPLKDKPLKDNTLKDNTLKDNTLKDKPLKDNTLKDSTLKDNTSVTPVEDPDIHNNQEEL